MLRRLLRSPRLDFCIRLLLAGMFVLAAVPKLMAPSDFAVVIGGYGLTPVFLNPVLAVVLPVVELALAAMLLLNKRGAVFGSLLLLTGFSMVLAYGIYLGLDVDCGCFGPSDPEGEAYHGLREALYRDLLFIGLCGLLALRRIFFHQNPPQEASGLGQTV